MSPKSFREPKSDKHRQAIAVMLDNPELRLPNSKFRLWNLPKLYAFLSDHGFRWNDHDQAWYYLIPPARPHAGNHEHKAPQNDARRNRVELRLTAHRNEIDNLVHLLRQAVELIDYQVTEVSKSYINLDEVTARVYLVMEALKHE